jgi:GWxTD domain-containing protein
MTFEKVGEQFRAMQEVRVALQSGRDQPVIADRTWRDTTVVSSYAATQRIEPFIFRRHIDAPPGYYEVEVTFENLGSGKSKVRHQRVDIPDSAERTPYMGKILVEARTDRGVMLPVVSALVPSGLDSLHCIASIYNLISTRPSLASLDLVRYLSDSLAASPPMFLTLLDLPMGYSAMNFDKLDTIIAFTRSIDAGTEPASLAIGLRGLSPGNYLASFQVQTPAEGSTTGDTLLHRERYLSLGGPTFPRPSTLSELIESMVYIAHRGEMKLLREAPTPEIARARFDSLWLSFRPDRREAAALINRYYSRVEEANQRFSTTKEGWKTDQGMVYIVLGPPVSISNSKDQQIWYYDHRGDDASNIYVFNRRYVTDGQVTLMIYTLYRQTYYEVFWNRMVDKWRSGEVF